MGAAGRLLVPFASVVCVVLMLGETGRAQTITEFSLPPGTGPFVIIVGPDEKLWFSEIAADGRAGPRLGRLTVDGVYSEVGSSVRGFRLTRGADAAVWVASSDQKAIIRVAADGAQTLFPVSSSYDALLGIATGSDGNIWFIEEFLAGGGRIGRITPAGDLTEFPLSLPPGIVPGLLIVPGPDGALWFTATTGLYRVTTAGGVTQVLPITIPSGFAWGPDGRIWFGDSSANAVKALEVETGAVSAYVLPLAGSFPGGITPGPDGAVWFLELSTTAQKIGRMTTAGVLAEYPIPPGGNFGLSTMTAGPDGNMWFTEPRVDKVARITVPAFPAVPRQKVILAPRRPGN